MLIHDADMGVVRGVGDILGSNAVTLHETLKAMRDLLSEPERWTKGVCARDARGFMTDSVKDNAVCWCLMGAANRVTNYTWSERELTKFFPGGNIAKFNDRSTHAEVLAKLDDAIKATAP